MATLPDIAIFTFVALSAYVWLVAGRLSLGQQAFFGIGAYCAGMATAIYRLPLSVALLLAAGAGAVAGMCLQIVTSRLRGVYFAIASLAFAEAIHACASLFRYQKLIDGELVGPDASQGFQGIRYIYERGVSSERYALFAMASALVLLLLFLYLERSALGTLIRMLGEDELGLRLLGVRIGRLRLAVAAVAGGLAALGGALYAHHVTYVDPENFGVMLGVHSVAYGLIGGLGTALGPLLGVCLDIGLLESLRVFSQYRMIIFGAVVSGLILFKPRGILDERMVAIIRRRFFGHAEH